jgi:hypothetical protein
MAATPATTPATDPDPNMAEAYGQEPIAAANPRHSRALVNTRQQGAKKETTSREGSARMSTDEPTDDEHPKSARSVTPGNAQGVPVPHQDAAEGTSEEYLAVEGVRTVPQSEENQHNDEPPAAGDYKDLSK